MARPPSLLTLLTATVLASACGTGGDGSTARIDVCGRGDRRQLADALAGGTLALTFRGADGQVLLLREAAADSPDLLPVALPAGTTSVDIEGLTDLGTVVATGTGAVLGSRACVCLALIEDFDFVCSEVSCTQEEASCSFFDPLEPAPCQLITDTETILDNDTPCVSTGGTAGFLRTESAGFGGSLVWTNTTDSASTDNFARWDLVFETAGLYRVEAFTAAEFGQASEALYRVAHGSFLSSIVVDQSASDEWSLIGDFEFDAGGVQFVFLGDNTNGPAGVHLAFDAIRLTRISP